MHITASVSSMIIVDHHVAAHRLVERGCNGGTMPGRGRRSYNLHLLHCQSKEEIAAGLMLLEPMTLLFGEKQLIQALAEASLNQLQGQYHCSYILQLVTEKHCFSVLQGSFSVLTFREQQNSAQTVQQTTAWTNFNVGLGKLKHNLLYVRAVAIQQHSFVSLRLSIQCGTLRFLAAFGF